MIDLSTTQNIVIDFDIINASFVKVALLIIYWILWLFFTNYNCTPLVPVLQYTSDFNS